jgi:FkbM family methyltransferase
MIFRLFKKAVFPKELKLKQLSIEGIEYLVWLNEEVGKQLLLSRGYERNNIKAFSRLVQKGDVCFDIGGNIGYYALNFAKMCSPAGHVYVFEPVEKNALVIKLSSLLNGNENISVIEKIVSDKNVELDLILPGDSAYAYLDQAGHMKGDKSEARSIKKPSITVDRFVSDNDINKVSLIKIDVEGAEGLVLEGAENILSQKEIQPRVIMMELVDEYLSLYNSSIIEIIEKMSLWGYRAYWADGKGYLFKYDLLKDQGRLEVFFINQSTEDSLLEIPRLG